jgi:hypothetical protein
MTMPDLIQSEQARRELKTTVGISWTFALKLGLGP